MEGSRKTNADNIGLKRIRQYRAEKDEGKDHKFAVKSDMEREECENSWATCENGMLRSGRYIHTCMHKLYLFSI
jgi:hypothetical protein